VGAGTLFNHGSCGKAYTGLLGAVLADAGIVDLDAPVRRLVPELRLPDAVVAERVTLRDLLSHRSGLGRHDMAWILHPSLDETEMLESLAHLPLAGDLRAQWLYSNFGFALAGLALGRAAGASWAEAVRKHVLDPLGMRRTFPTVLAVAAPDAADADVAAPHLLRDGSPVVTASRHLAAVAPAGEIVSCAEDSVRWLLAQLGESMLPAGAVATAQQAHMLLPPGMSPFPEMAFSGYGFGWLSGTFRGRQLVWHNGGVDGFSTQTLLLPQERIGVVVCANLYPTNLSFGAVLDIADALLDTIDETSWCDKLWAAESAVPPPAESPEGDGSASNAGPSRHVGDFAGRYADPGYGTVVVRAAGDDLTVRIGDYDLSARHRQRDTWDLHYAALDHDVTITFITDASGDVTEAWLPLDPGFPPVRFRREVAAAEGRA
jgi:CubicO group peptidase (beta-lactamase class C family)